MSQSRVIVRAGDSMPPDINQLPKHSRPTKRDLFSGRQSSIPAPSSQQRYVPQHVRTFAEQRVEVSSVQPVLPDGGKGNIEVHIRAQRYVVAQVRSGISDGQARILKWVELGQARLLMEASEDRGDLFLRLSPERFELSAEAETFASFVEYIQVYDASCPDHRIFIDPHATEEAMREIFLTKYIKQYSSARASLRLVRTPSPYTYLRIRAE